MTQTPAARDLERTLRRRGHDVRVDEDPEDEFNVHVKSWWPLWISWLWRWLT